MSAPHPCLLEKLACRGKELDIRWCDLHKDCMKNFIERRWVLVVDDRNPDAKAVVVINKEALVGGFQTVLSVLAEIAKKSNNKK